MFDHEKLDVYKAAIEFVILALDVCKSLRAISDLHYEQARRLLLRIVSMLIKMAQIVDSSGTHTGTGTMR